MTSVAALQQQQIAFDITYSAAVLYLFECSITLSQEVEVIWCRKWMTTTWVYALTRYSSLLHCAFVLIPIWGRKDCMADQCIQNILASITFLCSASFSALRVYALLGGRYLMTGAVFVLMLVPFFTNLYVDITSVVTTQLDVCTSILTLSPELLLARESLPAPAKFVVVDVLTVSLCTRMAVILGDILVLGVTWFKTAQSFREARRLNIKAPLAALLFRDGTCYFVVLLALNILQIIGANVPVLLTMDVSQPFQEVLPPIIICRFILNLRQVEHAGSSWVGGSKSGSIMFVGNIGQPVHADEEDPREADVGYTIDAQPGGAGEDVYPSISPGRGAGSRGDDGDDVEAQ